MKYKLKTHAVEAFQSPNHELGEDCPEYISEGDAYDD